MMSNERAPEEARPRGRYHTQYVSVSNEAEIQEELREILDAAEAREWHLFGVAGGLPEGGMVLFWDTTRPSFGRSSR
jgi:hypothetical protein